jgi:DNA-binding MarR family transcriptional regulator
MHTIFFGLKRAHHATLRLTRAPLANMGLTAARFDLLYAVNQNRRGVTQSALRRLLGVCRATVSKMLGSLEKLGLVRRSISVFDRRRKLVELTAIGKASFVRARREFMRSGWAQLAVDSALGAVDSKTASPRIGYRWFDPDECNEATSLLESMLGCVRSEFGDRAKLVYPWDPESVGAWDPESIGAWDLDAQYTP